MDDFLTRRRVEFGDTDMAGICHFARFFLFMETAEHECLRSWQVDLMTDAGEGRKIGWPRVAASCEYLAPARFGDVLDLRVRLVRRGRTSLTWEHEITRDGTPIARGTVTTVHCRIGPDGTATPVPLPAALVAVSSAPSPPGS